MKSVVSNESIKINAFKCPYCKFMSTTASGTRNHMNTCKKNTDIKLCRKCVNFVYGDEYSFERYRCKLDLEISRNDIDCNYFERKEY